MRIEYAGLTHVGMKRNHNEDSFLLVPEANLFIVADGMGGHASGEIASRIAVEEVAEFFRMTERDEEATWPFKMERARNYDENRINCAVKLANARIFEQALAEPKYKGMGTTIVSIAFRGGVAYIGHVGDSRVYRLRGGQLVQITEDHSLLNDYIKAKKLTPEEIEAFPHKNVIVRALGMKENVEVDVLRDEPQNGDLFVMCSDGLSGMVPDPQIQEIVSSSLDDLNVASERLIEAANAAGGTDNVTVVLSRFYSA
jgi:PPM family protein phosphatase